MASHTRPGSSELIDPVDRARGPGDAHGRHRTRHTTQRSGVLASQRATPRWLSAFLALAALVGGVLVGSSSAAAQEVPDSPAAVDVNARLNAIPCPPVPGLDLLPGPQVASTYEELGVNRPAELQGFGCSYALTGNPTQNRVGVNLTFRWAGWAFWLPCAPDPVREESGNQVRGRGIALADGINVELSYSFPTAYLATVPDLAAAIEAAFTPTAANFGQPLASSCQVPPAPVACPDVPGAVADPIEPPAAASLYSVDCDYELESGRIQMNLIWATDRSHPGDLVRACSDGGVQFRERTAIVSHGAKAIQARWLSYEPTVSTDALNAAAAALMQQVEAQARTCEGIAIEPVFTPLPPYLQAVFGPERTGGQAFINGRAGQFIAPATAAPASAPAPAPTTTPLPTTTSSPATTAPANTTSTPTVTIAPAASDTDLVDPTSSIGAVTDERPGWQTVGLRVISVVALALSLLGVALALFLMRRETRIRPKLEIARVVIVLAVAVVSIIVFSRGAPIWAIALALAIGGALGWFQGSNLTVRADGDRLFAKRVTAGVIAFAAALIVTQIAGWLNRTGAITVGIALSFLSAALTTGVIVGRRPQLQAARLGPGVAVFVIVAATLALAVGPSSTGLSQPPDETAPPAAPATAPATAPAEPPPATVAPTTVPPTTVPPATVPPATAPPPTVSPAGTLAADGVERPEKCGGLKRQPVLCQRHEELIDFVDWTNVSFNGGIMVGSEKPPVLISVPRGLATPPEPITRAITWNNRNGIPQSIDETFTFGLDDDGLCCSVMYEATGVEQLTESSGVNQLVASGRLSDFQPVGAGIDGGFTSISNIVQGVPFDEAQIVSWGTGGVDECARFVGETVANMGQEPMFTTLTENGVSQLDDTRVTKGSALTRMTIPCEVPGYTFEAALAASGEHPVGNDRESPCPTRQEFIGALATGGLPMTGNTSIGDMFITPNEPMCSDGSLTTPVTFGDASKGGTRSELMFEFAPPEAQTVWGDPSAIYASTGATTTPASRRCALDETGQPMANGVFERCDYTSTHQLENGGWIQVVSDLQYFDGPNVTVRASLPWGSYRYRCHHCELDSPEIERFLGALHDFAGGWSDALAAEEYGVIEETGEIVATTVPTTTVGGIVETVDAGESTTPLERDAEALGIDPELAELFIDEDDDDATSAAALAALVGLMGSVGLAGTALAESGMSASELAQTFRSGGLDALDDELEARARADAASVVVDEYGDELRPGEDGLYEWDDGDSVRRVERDELESLIGDARVAQAALVADEAARLAEHERFRNASWEDLRERVRTQTAIEMNARELAAAERQALFDRGIRLRDALEGMEDTPLRERMLDLLEREPAPSDETFWTLRDIMRQQESDQRAIDALGDQSEMSMALEGIQRDIARLAGAAGQPGLATIVRNPEIPARLATAYATGGFSEVALAPIDLWLTLEGKADAVMAAENRDLTTMEITQEVALAVVTEYLGSRLFGGAEVPEPPKRPMQLLPQNYIEQVKPGQRIPLLHQTGYTPDHLQRLTRFADRYGVVPGTRTANQYSAAHIRAGTALPKPLGVKPKTINEIDLHLGARADHMGTVGFFEPTMPDTSQMSRELREQIEARFAARVKEQSKYLDEIRANPNLRIEGGRVVDAKTGKAFAGDMDLVYLRDARTGEVIRGQRYIELRDQMIEEGLIEHGAEFNIRADFTEGLTPGTQAFRDAEQAADGIVDNVLMPNHRDGALIMEVRNGVAVRGEPITAIPRTP